MHCFRIRKTTVHTVNKSREDAAWYVHLLLLGFFRRRKLFPSVIKAHALRKRLASQPALFIAHGCCRKGVWLYKDKDSRLRSVQRWIDRHDGEASALILFCCNAGNLEIRSRRSIIIHLNRAASAWDLFKGGCLRLYHPEFGYIEDRYEHLHRVIQGR